jgi:hypothetical protein
VLDDQLYVIFRVMKSEWPIIITNGVPVALGVHIPKCLPRRKKDAVADVLDPNASSLERVESTS